MECLMCGSKKIQFKLKNTKTLIIEYKCLSCNQILINKRKRDRVI